MTYLRFLESSGPKITLTDESFIGNDRTVRVLENTFRPNISECWNIRCTAEKLLVIEGGGSPVFVQTVDIGLSPFHSVEISYALSGAVTGLITGQTTCPSSAYLPLLWHCASSVMVLFPWLRQSTILSRCPSKLSELVSGSLGFNRKVPVGISVLSCSLEKYLLILNAKGNNFEDSLLN